MRLTHERFRADMQGLIKALQLTLEEFEAHRRASSDAKWQSEQPQRDTSAAKRRGRMMVAGGTLVVLLIAAALIMARSLNIGSGRLQIAASAVPASADVAAPPSKPAPVSQPAAAAEPEFIAPQAAPSPPPALVVPSSSPAETAPPPSADKMAWSLVKDTTDNDSLKRFVSQYPDSPYRKDAETQIVALTQARSGKEIESK